MTVMLALLLATVLVLAVWFLRSRPVALGGFLVIATLPLAFGSTGGALISSTIALSILTSQPLFVLLGAITLVSFEFLSDIPPADYGMFPEKIFELSDKNVLLAIPFFVISGAIMTHGGIARRLIAFASALTRTLPGGLGLAAIGGCVLFAAISGSSPVTVIAIGGMMYPALVKDGFGERQSIGLLSSAGSLGIVIPPSIPMILYAIVVSGRQVVEVGELFLAGVGPGFLIGSLLGVYVVGSAIVSSDDKRTDVLRLAKWLGIALTPIVIGELLVPVLGPWAHFLGPAVLVLMGIAVAFKSFVDGFWALMLPVIILGGIYSGFFSPTQAAAVAVVYALVVELFIHREVRWRDLPGIVVDSTLMMGALIVIMVIAFVFNDYLVEEKIPEQAVDWLATLDLSRVTFLLGVNILLLIVGCFMDILSAILIIAPLIVPMAAGFDIDPIHMGIIFIVNLELGYLTPPLGLNLFVSSTLFQKSLGEVIRSVIPYTIMMLAGIVVITYVPQVALAPGQWIAEIRASFDAPAEPLAPGDKPDPGRPSADGRVLSIEELMQAGDEDDDASETDAAEGQSSPTALPTGIQKDGTVRSIEDLMGPMTDDDD